MPRDAASAMRSLLRDVMARHPDVDWIAIDNDELRDALVVQHAASKLFAGHPLTLISE